MRVDGNQGSTLGYEPNSYGEWHSSRNSPNRRSAWRAPPTTGTIARTTTLTQPGLLFGLMTGERSKGAL